MPSIRQRIAAVLLGVDETMNAALGGRPRETISGTVGRAAISGAWWAKLIAVPLINFLMANPKHCADAAADEAARRRATQTFDLHS